MISGISDYLHPDESVIILTRRHPATLIAPIILGVAGLTAALLYTASSRNNGIIVILIWSAFGLLVMNLIYKALDWWAACFVVSSKRMLLITGVVTRLLSDSLDLDKVRDIGFERSVIGRLLGYGSLVGKSADNNQKRRLNYISPRVFERIAREIPSNAQQADVERGGDHAAVDKDRPASVAEDSDRLHRRKSIVLIFIWIAGFVAAVVVAEIPRIGTLANSELPIIAVVLAATGPYVGSRWTSRR
jgi:uncharacterized membrane protein YdbT with pleckstrin-like domain